MIEGSKRAGDGLASAKTVSVCLCTWNGDRFLSELLTSLSRQTRLPDELVVCDDMSTDGTLAILHRFAEDAPFTVRLRRNAERAGVIANFEQAVRWAKGDVLFLCDQDDVWDPRKIDLVSDRFAGADPPNAVLHDSSLIDSAGTPLAGTLWELVGFGERQRREFEQCGGFQYLIGSPLAAGHALAFTASARPLLVPLSLSANYDTWIAQVIAATGRIELLAQSLVAYRMHEANAIGLRARAPIRHLLGTAGPSRERLGRVAAGLRDLEVRLDERAPGSLSPRLRSELHATAEHLEGRARLGGADVSVPQTARGALWVAKELFGGAYRRHSNGVRSALFDLWRSVQAFGHGAPAPDHHVRVPLPSTASVTAVVVEYHSGEALGRCLEALRQNQVDDIIVVDNGASDAESVSSLAAQPGVLWIASPDNPGFGGGVNRGAADTDADLILICNPDIVVEPGAVDQLRAALVGSQRAGAVGPALVDVTDRITQSARSFPTLRSSWQQAFLGLVHPSGRRSSEYRQRNRSKADGGVVDWVTGACILARADAFREIGGFDAGYFLYVEEVDFCWRLREAGWQVLYEPRARVAHVGAVSTSARPYRAIVAHHRSLWRFARLTTSGVDRAALPIVAVAIVVRCGLACVTRSLRSALSVPHARAPSAVSDR